MASAPCHHNSSQMSAESSAYLADKGIHELVSRMMHHVKVQGQSKPETRPLRCCIEFLEAEMERRGKMQTSALVVATDDSRSRSVLPV